MTKQCTEHGVALIEEPLTRSDGTQIGNLTLALCPVCEDETEDGFESFLGRVRNGDFGDD